MDKWFHKQSKILQVILLLIPGVNWVFEVLVRWSAVVRKANPVNIVIAIVVTVFGAVVGWLDAIFVIITNKLLLE